MLEIVQLQSEIVPVPDTAVLKMSKTGLYVEEMKYLHHFR